MGHCGECGAKATVLTEGGLAMCESCAIKFDADYEPQEDLVI